MITSGAVPALLPAHIGVSQISQMITAQDFADPLSACGLFVPKPPHHAGYQGCGLPGLGSTVRQCPLVSGAVGGDCYSLGYSVARENYAGVASTTYSPTRVG